MSTESRPQANLIQTVTGETFKHFVLDDEGPIAVEFMSYGCGHCRTMEPIVQEAAELLKSRVHVFRVNVAVDEDLAAGYNVQGTPTFVMFHDAHEVGRAEGPPPQLASLIDAITKPFVP